jgi:cytochrome c553
MTRTQSPRTALRQRFAHPVAATTLLAFALYLAPTAVMAQAAPAAAPAPTFERGQQIATAVCAACHGPDGNSPTSANPIIAGQVEQYITGQLKAFKIGAGKGGRVNAIMQGFAAGLSESDMKSLGIYYSRQAVKPAVATDKALAERGAEIYRAGIKRDEVPACSGCHGPAGLGIPAQYPRLAGQYPEYTYEELKHYASGERKNAIMATIAKRLSDDDKKALAQFTAGLRYRRPN